MSDLTDEELIATRKLNGLYDDLFRENIEIGEYVRTNTGLILKYDDENEKTFIDNFLTCPKIMKERIVKHSKQLENLIEVNDIVNGYRILGIYEATESNNERILDIGYGMAIFNDEIKTILTKELYEANCYKVGGEDGI